MFKLTKLLINIYIIYYILYILYIYYKKLAKMCKRKKFQFLEHSNINPKAHLNKTKVHLNRNGYIKLGKNFANFINNNNNA